MENKPAETPPPPLQERRIISEGRGKYTCVDNTRVYHFDFPAQTTLLQNYDIISYFKAQIWKAIQEIEGKKKEEENKCERTEEKDKASQK